VYVEITPFDLVKYEMDKETGYLRVDRPQRTSSSPPTLYGFIPGTYCGPRMAALSPRSDRGDGDPLDVCVISERPISRADLILEARVVGGIQAVDHGEADDKIVAVLDGDAIWSGVHEISELPPALVERLRHYLSTYKLVVGEEPHVRVVSTYGAEHAWRVVDASIRDYGDAFGRRVEKRGGA
jgi:inorganic pyrophosphatase